MRRRLAGLAALLLATGAVGQPRPALARDPEAVIVQELVVTARRGGPAWWRVTAPNGAVAWVMGIPEALPRGLKWDQTLLRLRLKGAQGFVGPPAVQAGLGDVFTLIRLRGAFRSRTPMEASLPPALKARFLRDREQLGKDSRAYSGWTPLVAALLMIQDFRKQAGLELRQPASQATSLAHAAGVRVVPAGVFRAVPFVQAVRTGLDREGPACLEDALDEIEAGPQKIRAAAQGWAHGDVAAALAAQRGYEKCLASLPQGADLADTTMADTARTLEARLGAGGETVAVVDLRILLAQGGVLQRLQARGFKVDSPGS
ncbi:MAG TPA: TraB/GumN family protein [Caulobacteraceae bacterium]|nr:TraB/GumN family protein [Caulobacteraceae bacterium]